MTEQELVKEITRNWTKPPQDTIIEMLEGMEIQTPDSQWHLVRNSQFETDFGTSKLFYMSMSVLTALYRTARKPDPIRDIIETANSEGRYFMAKIMDNDSLVVRENSGWLIIEKFQNGLPVDAFVIGMWNIHTERWEQKASSEEAQRWLQK